MRDTDSIEPMWEEEARSGLGARVVGAVTSVGGGVLRRAFPHLFRWARGQRPGLVLAWGATEYRLARDGVRSRRRPGNGWQDNPRSNYNEAVGRRQEREAARADADALTTAHADAEAARAELDAAREELEAARAEVVQARAEADDKVAAAQAPKVDLGLTPDAIRAAVKERMGMDVEAPDVEIDRDPDGLRQQIAGMRALLQGLDDVKDFDLVDAIDDELYKLHKAVEYKLKNHRASEAKAKLRDLFK